MLEEEVQGHSLPAADPSYYAGACAVGTVWYNPIISIQSVVEVLNFRNQELWMP